MSPSAENWILVWEGHQLLVTDQATIDVLVQTVPLSIVPPESVRPDLNERAVLIGRSENEISLKLQTRQGERFTRISLQENAGPFAEWAYGDFDDRWIDCSAAIDIFMTASAYINVYLPERSPLGAKAVHLSFNGTSLSKTVERGSITRLGPAKLNGATTRVVLQSDSPEPKINQDVRHLGVVLVSVDLDGHFLRPQNRPFPILDIHA